MNEKKNIYSLSIKEMRKENGEPLLTEEELPTATEESRYYQYASHAINGIGEAYEKGNILNEGTIAWY